MTEFSKTVADKRDFSFEQQLTSAEIKKFSEYSGDLNPIHLMPNSIAKSNGKRVVTHGMLLLLKSIHGLIENTNYEITLPISFDARFKDIAWSEENLKFLWSHSEHVDCKVVNCSKENIPIAIFRFNSGLKPTDRIKKRQSRIDQFIETFETPGLIPEILVIHLAKISKNAGNNTPGFGSLLGRVSLTITTQFNEQVSSDFFLEELKTTKLGRHSIVRFRTPYGAGEYQSIQP